MEKEANRLRIRAEEFIAESCHVLSLGQKCADWFILRHFRVTGTNAGQLLFCSPQIRQLLELEGAGLNRTDEGWFGALYKSWFSSQVSSEAMMRGTANEVAVLLALGSMEFFKTIYEISMVALRDDRYLGCSPDGVAWLDISGFGE